ncbi:putative transferase [Nymphaea thermarum]|nr:putative transferase [Nymphaea thermarum]
MGSSSVWSSLSFPQNVGILAPRNSLKSVESGFPGTRFLPSRIFPNGRIRVGFLNQAKLLRAEASPFDFEPPPIDHDLQDAMVALGAETLEDGSVETFGNDELALEAVEEGVAVVDLSHFGRIRVTGEDRINYLHNQSTANFQSLGEGQGCDTVFVTPTARTIDISHAWVLKNAVLLHVSPETCSSIIDMLNRYIFFSDKVEVQDLTKTTCFFTLMGPKSSEVISNLNLSDLLGKPYGTHHHYSVNKAPVTVGIGSVLSEEGFSLLLTQANAEPVWKALLTLGAVPMGTKGWERLRVLRGRPAPAKELTDEYNVLEACLWKAISLNKGCYKGQETIARLVTYDGVKQKLWGIHLDGPAEPGSAITVNGKKVGMLTSYSAGSREPKHAGLGYVKKQACTAGLEVVIGDAVGTLVDVPFLIQQPEKVAF